jgi:hypothetical protein
VEYGSPKEHIFAFILGFQPENVSNLVKLLRIFWEKPTTKLKPRHVGLTTRLFLAAALKVYGFREAEDSVRKAFGKLEAIYDELKGPKRESEEAESEQNVSAEGEKKTMTEDEQMKKWKEEFDEQIKSCNKLSSQLMHMDKALPGVRSRVHFVGLCAQGLLREESHMHRYIEDELERLGKEIARREDFHK